MTKRLQPCRTCSPSESTRFQRRGFTRHANRICAACRREARGITVTFAEGVLHARLAPEQARMLGLAVHRGTLHYGGRGA